ncbi:MAG: 4-alpha-glucanotransferase [Actinomycetota bacterium]
MIGTDRGLLELAAACGVQTSYRDTTGRRRTAGPDALRSVLVALGESAGPDGHEHRRRRAAERILDPVLVAWDGRRDAVEVRIPAARAPSRITVRLDLEGGDQRAWSVRTEDARSGEGTAELRLDADLPFGRHELTVGVGRRTGVATVLSSPRRVHAARGPRDWGVFVPLHALVSEGDWGIGDLGALGRLADGVRELGGGVVATLPLLAGFPGEPSPYRPASRLFWNEIYVDPASIPELERIPSARRLMRTGRFARELAAARAGRLVDHDRVLALKRRVLAAVARALDGEGASALRRFVRVNPEVETYARFRAAGERFGLDWRRWPAAVRRERPRLAELDADAVAYHRLAQWVAERQVSDLGRRAGGAGTGLYLDMPLGVHPDGYDAWRHPAGFAPGVSVGAPPDDFFPGGQDWGFPPLHPERVREDGYAYPIACLRHVFRHAGVARIDHAIGLHRQYWVPAGAPADEGVFVRYPAEEWYAAICLEAHRTGTLVVGEDLGTVPTEVRRALSRHDLLRSYVLELETVPEHTPPVPKPSASSLAALNTHDLPTFAAFWRGLDIRERVEAGFLADERAETRRRAAMRADLVRVLERARLLTSVDADDDRAVLAACLAWLAGSRARLVVVNLEDLWGERHQQNVPGTAGPENWRRRAAATLEDVWRSPEIVHLLRTVDAARRGTSVGEGDAA